MVFYYGIKADRIGMTLVLPGGRIVWDGRNIVWALEAITCLWSNSPSSCMMYPAGEETGVSAAVSKISGRESVVESTSILGVRDSSTSCSDDDEEDAGRNRSGGGDASIDTFSVTAQSPSTCAPSLVDGPSQGAFDAGSSKDLNISLSDKLLKHSDSSSLRDSSSNRSFVLEVCLCQYNTRDGQKALGGLVTKPGVAHRCGLEGG